MYTMNGAQLIIKMLERQGIEMIAGIPGGANLPLYDALFESSAIKHILCRHIRKHLSFEYNSAFISFVVAMLNSKINR